MKKLSRILNDDTAAQALKHKEPRSAAASGIYFQYPSSCLYFFHTIPSSSLSNQVFFLRQTTRYHIPLFSQPVSTSARMDQNLEPKVDPPQVNIKAKRLSPEESGIYLNGETSPRSFVGYIKDGAWTDEQVQEYIEVQKRLAPDCVKERERAENTKAEGSTAKTGTTVAPAAKESSTRAFSALRLKSPELLEVIPETDDEE